MCILRVFFIFHSVGLQVDPSIDIEVGIYLLSINLDLVLPFLWDTLLIHFTMRRT